MGLLWVILGVGLAVAFRKGWRFQRRIPVDTAAAAQAANNFLANPPPRSAAAPFFADVSASAPGYLDATYRRPSTAAISLPDYAGFQSPPPGYDAAKYIVHTSDSSDSEVTFPHLDRLRRAASANDAAKTADAAAGKSASRW